MATRCCSSGLLAPDPALETYRVPPGGATEVASRAAMTGSRIVDRARRPGRRVLLGRPRGGRHCNAATDGNGTRSRLFGPDSRARASDVELDRRPRTPRLRRRRARRPDRRRRAAADRAAASRCGGRSRARREEVELPPPLAEPRLDFRVDAATALSYEVKAGEYIQVIDVKGKQCSDFLAFHAQQARRTGVERGLDATITRTLMGNAYPQPGLYGKFYDLDMDPLVEVVRDTVGRHDTFALACPAKYYEDLGYPGHVNCTDNFNGALERVRDRAAQGLGGAQLLLQHRRSTATCS